MMNHIPIGIHNLFPFLLTAVPLLAAVFAYLAGGRSKTAKWILAVTAVLHSAMSCTVAFFPQWRNSAGHWIGFDTLGVIILGVTSVLFLAVSLQTLFWMDADDRYAAGHAHLLIFGRPIFLPAQLAFLATMTLVISARNFGLLWVAVEATTLVSAPLICYHLSDRSLEAMWKYLLICSVGIGLALFGTMAMALSAHAAGVHGLGFDELSAASEAIHPGWFKAAFVFILAGYGTKMGLAPFHTWLPDAHSEAPGTISALLSGALLNCSFLGIVRVMDIAPGSLQSLCNELLLILGMLSLAVAAFFILRQTDFKRMLAYSSVEHMGLIAILWAIGLEQAAVLHIGGHSLIKMTLFMLAGNILLAYGTRNIAYVGGIFKTLNANALLWITGILLICGTPPSPLFITEFFLVQELLTGGHPILGALVLLLLFTVFAGMARICLKMCMGEAINLPAQERLAACERLSLLPSVSLAGALMLGTAVSILILKTIVKAGC